MVLSSHSESKPQKKKIPYKSLLTGSISGAISRTVTNPLERLKMLKQVNAIQYEGLSTARSLAFMWSKEGWYGMLKGNGVNVVRIAPFTAFEFFFYDLYKRFIFGGKDASPLKKLICGGMTGMTASFLTYPLDLIRTVMAVKVDNVSAEKPTILGTGRQVFAEGGVRGLYRGLPASLYGIIPYVGIKMASYDILKTYFLVTHDHPHHNLYNFVIGGLAGTISVTITYPGDLVRRKLQMSGTAGYEAYDGIVDCCKKINAESGIKGLYKGLVPCLYKVAPAMAIMFWCNDFLKEKLGRD